MKRTRLLLLLVLLMTAATGAWAQTETLADGSYYVKNGALSLYMAAGGEWGTHGIVNERGLDLIFTYNSGTKTYTIDSNLDNGSDHFLGTGLYMDGPSFGWTVEGENSFTISAILDGVKHYLAVDQNNNLVYTQDGTAENAQWIIIPKADHENAALAAGLDAMKAATAENGVDATFLIACPGFNRNDKRNAEAWTVEGNRLKMGGAGPEGNGCAESYNSTFTLSQTLSNAPAGVYTLTAQGFYKQNGSDNENLPYFYANDEKQTFKLLEDQVSSMSDAGPLFTQGKYTIDPITVVVAEDGALTIGAKLETNTTLWSCWDNFKLTYYGPLMYSVTFAEDTPEPDKWTASPNADVKKGQTVTVTYTGTRKVIGVKAEKKAAAPAYPMASEATAADYGKVVCAAGHLHDAKTAVPEGCTAVAVFAYIDGGNKRMGIALQDAENATWNMITTDGAYNNTLCAVPGTWNVAAPTDAEWFVGTKEIYEAIFTNLGSTTSHVNGKSYDDNVNAFITTGVGGTALSDVYWCTTSKTTSLGWKFSGIWSSENKTNTNNVRPVLGF